MKTLIGIDLNDRWQAAMELFIRLRFANAEATLLHSLEWQSPGGFIPPVQAEARKYEAQREAASAACASAAARLAASHIVSDTVSADGDPIRSLIHRADDIDADLIVAGSTAKGRFGSLFFGSVGKGLVIGARQSLLIGKAPVDPAKPLTAVLATDHSRYIERCMNRLLHLCPRGIDRLVVMTACEVAEPQWSGEEPACVRSRLEEENARVCRMLKPLCADCEARIVEADPVAAIHATMMEVQADLLILGAQGHGFFERLTAGSVSLYEVVAEPFNTLVLRSSG